LNQSSKSSQLAPASSARKQRVLQDRSGASPKEKTTASSIPQASVSVSVSVSHRSADVIAATAFEIRDHSQRRESLSFGGIERVLQELRSFRFRGDAKFRRQSAEFRVLLQYEQTQSVKGHHGNSTNRLSSNTAKRSSSSFAADG